MFSWFLKLLGINEDRPASSENTFLDTSKKIESERSASATTIETPQQPEPEQPEPEQPEPEQPEPEKSPEPEAVIEPEVKPEAEKAEEPEPEPVPEPESIAEPEADKSEPEPEEESEPKPTPEATPEPEQAKSLADDFPGLKANVIKTLNNAGFTSKDLIDKASDKELLALKGIGPASIKVFRS